MPRERFNDQDKQQLSAWFQRRNEAQFAWKSAVSASLALAGLRALWPMSAVAFANPQALDVSGNANHLRTNNVPTFGYTGLIPHVTFNGTTQYLHKVDGGATQWADIRGDEGYIEPALRGLTFGGWFNQDAQTAAPEQGLISKFNTVGNQRSYLLETLDVGAVTFPRFFVSGNGIAIVGTTGANIAFGEWFFCVCRFVPSTSTDLYFASESTPYAKTSNLAGIPALIFDSGANFEIGSFNTGTFWLDGKASLCFLCAAQLSDVIIQSLFQQTRAMFGV